MSESNSTLVSHVDTSLVTRVELAKVITPDATETFKPVPHLELIETIEAQLLKRDIRIIKEQFALRHDGSRLFGTFDLTLNGIEGACASMGFRTSNDRSMSIQVVAGMRVFVCDNLALRGELIALKRKHTSGLILEAEVGVAIERYVEHYATLKGEVAILKERALDDNGAKALIHDVFMAGAMPFKFYQAVTQEYFNPRHVEFEPRTVWSLHNAFTEVQKLMPLNRRIESTQEIGKLLLK